MLDPGQPAPDFVLSDDHGQPVRLGELLVRGPVLLYFYPADFTGGCTREACAFRDLHDSLAVAGVQVVGVSPQSVDSHAAFRARHGLPFPLLSDPDRLAARLYDALGPLGLGVARVSYLIGPDGTIQDAVRAELAIGAHRAFGRAAGSRQ